MPRPVVPCRDTSRLWPTRATVCDTHGAVALLKTLPDDEQERAANVLMAFAQERSSYDLSDDQLAGIHHAMGQADRSEFASEADIVELFGHRL